MNQILPERARWSYLARSGLPAVSRKKNFSESHIINPLLTKLVWSRWLDIGLVLFLRVYGPRRNAQKKNLVNIQPSWPHIWSITRIYYTASSASGQDEPNRALWLATRAGKMEPSCPLGTTRCIPQVKCTKSHIINPLLTKFFRSRWLDIGLVFFREFMDLDFVFVSVHKHEKKELNLANIQPSWPKKLGQ